MLAASLGCVGFSYKGPGSTIRWIARKVAHSLLITIGSASLADRSLCRLFEENAVGNPVQQDLFLFEIVQAQRS